MSQHLARTSPQHFARILLGATCLLVGSIAGCGQNPMVQGKAVPPPGKVADPAAAPVAGDPQPGIQPNDPAVPAADRPVAKTPLVRGLSELLNTNPALEDDVKDPLRDQLQQADDILSGIKSQNRAALREINRQQRHRRSDSPNVVMIIADNLRMEELSGNVGSKFNTPYINQLVSKGTRFTQFYAGSPDPVAAHWCLATGRRPDQATAWSKSQPVLQSEDLTIAEVMWQAGYTTGVFGDWGVQGPQGPATPADQGFDRWLGAYGSLSQPQPFPATLLNNGQPLKLTKNAAGEHGQLAQDFYLTEAIDFLNRARRPAFIQIYVTISGVPVTPAELAKYDQSWPDELKARAVALARLDQGVSKMMNALDAIKQLGNTVFILTSATSSPDARHLAGSTAAPQVLRGGPGDLYEGGLRVPLIIYGTRRIPVGESRVVSAAWDLAPTVYDLVGAQKRPAQKFGQSLSKLLQPKAALPTRYLYWEAQHGTAEVAARWQNWKVVRHAKSQAFELYDLEADPSEMHDVAAEHPEVLAEFQKRMAPATEQAKR